MPTVYKDVKDIDASIASEMQWNPTECYWAVKRSSIFQLAAVACWLMNCNAAGQHTCSSEWCKAKYSQGRWHARQC